MLNLHLKDWISDSGLYPLDMRMGKISNITNSNDPHAINSRIFVGNLNTFTLTKDDVECVFKRYGRIIGISMHKGYAFVQYTSEVDARNAVAGEDQRVYATQPIDVNMASEPKPNRPSRKRPQGAGAEWDYYYNAPLLPRGVLSPPLKRPRPDHMAALPPGLKPPPGLAMMATGFKRTLVPLGNPTAALLSKRNTLSPKQRLKGRGGAPAKDQPSFALETPDILICGQCKQLFPNLERLAEHKQVKCRLRVVTTFSARSSGREEPVSVTCATCQTEFCSSWDLIVHAQQEHNLTIFSDSTNNTSADHTETQSDAGSSKAGESSDTESKPTEGANSDVMDGETVAEGLSDGISLVPGGDDDDDDEETPSSGDLDESYSAAIEQSILQQAMESDQQQQQQQQQQVVVEAVGNGE